LNPSFRETRAFLREFIQKTPNSLFELQIIDKKEKGIKNAVLFLRA